MTPEDRVSETPQQFISRISEKRPSDYKKGKGGGLIHFHRMDWDGLLELAQAGAEIAGAEIQA